MRRALWQTFLFGLAVMTGAWLVVFGGMVAEEAGPVNVSAALESPNETRTPSTNDGELSPILVEQEIEEEVNERRTESGFQPLKHDSRLARIAEYHSDDMVNRSYYAHTSPDGETFEMRYERFGYECQVPVSERSYLTGSENINIVYADGLYETYGTGEIVSPGFNESRIAEIVVNEWMHSDGHRENLLNPHWDDQGVGIATTQTENGTAVYVTQNFC